MRGGRGGGGQCVPDWGGRGVEPTGINYYTVITKQLLHQGGLGGEPFFCFAGCGWQCNVVVHACLCLQVPRALLKSLASDRNKQIKDLASELLTDLAVISTEH